MTAPRYQPEIHEHARAFLEAQTEKVRGQMVEKIGFILDDPFRKGTKQLEGAEWLEGGLPIRRIRSGDYRILYTANRDTGVLTVVDIGRRADIYGRHR